MLTRITANIAPVDAAAASGLSNMLRNLGGAVGTDILGTILTKREQFPSNIISQSVTLARDEMRDRINQSAGYFTVHGVSDYPCLARQPTSVVEFGAGSVDGDSVQARAVLC